MNGRADGCEGAHSPQVFERERHTQAEHQEDHAHVSQQRDLLAIANESRREWSNGYAGQQVAEDGRLPQPAGEKAARHGDAECDGNVQDQRGFTNQRGMIHVGGWQRRNSQASGEKIVGNVACVARRTDWREAAVFATSLPQSVARVAS